MKEKAARVSAPLGIEAVPQVIPKQVSTNRPRTLPTLVNPLRLFFLGLRFISQEDGQRRQELNDRLGINSIGRSLSDEVRESIFETQELKIEKALRSDRFPSDSHSFLLRIYDACQHPHTCNLVCL